MVLGVDWAQGVSLDCLRQWLGLGSFQKYLYLIRVWGAGKTPITGAGTAGTLRQLSFLVVTPPLMWPLKAPGASIPKEAGRSLSVLFLRTLEITHCLSHHILFIEAVTKPGLVSRGRGQILLLIEGMSRTCIP